MPIEKHVELPKNAVRFVVVYVEHNSSNVADSQKMINAFRNFLNKDFQIVVEPTVIARTCAIKAKMRLLSKIIKEGIVDVEQVKTVDVVCNLLDEQSEITWERSKNATSYIVNELLEGNFVQIGSTSANKFKCDVSQGKHTYRIDATNGTDVVLGTEFSFCK